MDALSPSESETSTAAVPPAGTPRAMSGDGFLLEVGTMAAQVTSNEGSWLDSALQRYGAFARPNPQRPDEGGTGEGGRPWVVHYEVLDGAPPTPEDLCQARRHGLHAGSESTWMGQGFSACRQPSSRRVDAVGPAAIYPLDLLLQALWYVSRPSSLIMHAAALQDGHRGWLCAGPSGSGKSTLVSLCSDRAMGDELVAVEATGDGFDLVALPFWRARPGRHALAGVCSLRHRGKDAVPPHIRRRLTRSEALARLRGQVSWPTWDSGAMVKCLDVLGRLVESMPVDELAFTPQPDVWEFLTWDAAVDSERAGR